ncbi:MAG: hypothetical protein HUJ25_04990 [Crocinitomicaceae bacterium]|nr:hypothetical protein [Crocinitomicaceae bacterium]
MSRSRLIWRIVLAGITLLTFVFLAIYLYQKQQVKINYLSFTLENAEHSFVVPDIDRLIGKLEAAEDLGMEHLHPHLKDGINVLIERNDFSFNREVTKECFISSNETDFTIAFKTTSSINSLLRIISDGFSIQATTTDKGIELNGNIYFANHYGQYLAVSTQPLNPIERTDKLRYGNSDYVDFGTEQAEHVRHILSKKYHFRLWNKRAEFVKGRPVFHGNYFEAIPADFDEIIFYGSTRISEDINTYFNQPDPQSFAWLSDGLVYIRKGDNEIIMARQGETRDLNLMLEEQTLKNQEDVGEIAYFNIGNFKIMPFQSDFNWKESISELDQELNYYTEYNSFNLLSNSIPSMRWFLGQVQLGNLIANNQAVNKIYQECLPESSHYVRLLKDETNEYLCQSRIYERDSTCLYSEVTSGSKDVQMEGVEVVYDFPVDIIPTKLTAVEDKGKNYILLNNSKELSLYEPTGEQSWKLTLSTPLVEDPQIVDFENDGHFEVVLFQSNQIDVVNNKGKSLNGFPVMLNGTSSAGLAVNYDNLFKWRLIVNVDNSVKVYSEQGKNVEGFLFQGMNAPIKGKIYHVITKGKDIITFKDKGNTQHVLNRRGEYRLENVNFSLANETDFIVGSLESALRKMGYKDGYIYNYYILDGQRDSVIIDQTVSPIKTYWEYNQGKPLLIVEEPDRLLIINQFGYVQSEVLKPNKSNQFVGLVGQKDYGFVFADNSENSIYLLNNYGKMILPQAVEGSAVSIIEGKLLYTFSGISVKAYKIAD